jgi:hypothetical protein
MSEQTIKQAEAYNLQDTVHLLAASFRYSRGSPKLQHCIFRFWAANYDERFDHDTVLAAADPVAEIASKMIYKSGIHPPQDLTHDKSRDRQNRGLTLYEGIQEEAATGAEQLLDKLTDPEFSGQPLSKGLLFKYLTRAQLSKDERWRPFTQEKPWYTTGVPVRYRSHLVDHGMLGRSTGLPEMDAFFQTIYGAYESPASTVARKDHIEAGKRIANIVGAHLAYNPEDTPLLMQVQLDNDAGAN